MTIIKVVSGLIAICVVCVVRPFRVARGVLAAMLPRSTSVRTGRFVDGLNRFVDGATYEFVHKDSTVVRTFFADATRAEAHGTDSFTLADYDGTPGLQSYQKHLPSGEPLLGVGAWHNECNFFGPHRTARIRLVDSYSWLKDSYSP